MKSKLTVPQNIFRATEVDANRTGWVVDLSPLNVVDPDCRFFFGSKAQAVRFHQLVKSGVAIRDALRVTHK